MGTGYALFFTVQEAMGQDPLVGVESSARYLHDILRLLGYRWFAHVRNEACTRGAVWACLMALARRAQPGDTVTLLFATHGESTPSNRMLLYDAPLNEATLAGWLCHFRPGVAFNVVFDVCSSGTWLRLGDGMATPDLGAPPPKKPLSKKISQALQLTQAAHTLRANPTVIYSACDDGGRVNDSLNLCFFLYHCLLEGIARVRTPAELQRAIGQTILAGLREGLWGLPKEDVWSWVAHCSGNVLLFRDGTTPDGRPYSDLPPYNPVDPLHARAVTNMLPNFNALNGSLPNRPAFALR